MKICAKCYEAKQQSQFYRNKLCKDGFESSCKACCCARSNSYYYTNYEKSRNFNALYQKRNKLRCNKQKRRWAVDNPDKTWHSKYPEKAKESMAKYARNNRGKLNALTAKRDALKKKATPSWLTKNQFKVIKQLYIDSSTIQKSTNVPHNVDHIIPIQNPLVCGLHVPWNLQILTRFDNYRKNSTFDGTYDNESWRNK